MFSLRVLGGLSLARQEGSPSAVTSQKRPLALLAVLAVAGDNGLTRERVQAFLWPESSAERARHALDQLLYRLRRALAADPVLTQGHELRLNAAVVATDLAEFDAAVSDRRWQDVVRLYTGPLLNGVHLSNERELESFIDGERARLFRDYSAACEALAREASAAGDQRTAAGWWEALARADPYSSRAALEVIRARAEAGERADALQYAQRFQRLLADELDVGPDPLVARAADEIAAQLRSELAHSPESRWTSPAPAPATEPRAPVTGGHPSVSADRGDRARTPRSRRVRSRWAILGAPAVVIVLAGSLAHGGADLPRSGASLPHTPDPAARVAYLRGLVAWSSRTPEGLDTAVIYFRRAVEKDPAFAEAYAGLANAYVLLGYSGYRPAGAMFPKARAAALEGIRLDSTLAAPRAALAHELMGERQFDAAEAQFRRAIALDPRYATAHQWYAMLLALRGRIREAVRESGRAAELDPLSLQIQNTHATFLNAAGHHAAAMAHFDRVAVLEPDTVWVQRNPWLLTNMAAVYAANGRYDQALRYARLALRVVPSHPRAVTALAAVQLAMGDSVTARRTFERADPAHEQYAVYRGMMHARLGALDSAFFWFDRTTNWGIPVMINLRTDLQFGAMRRDMRFSRLLHRLGIEREEGTAIAAAAVGDTAVRPQLVRR